MSTAIAIHGSKPKHDQLPQAKESEPAVNACILLDPRQYDPAAEIVSPDDFLSVPDGIIFDTLGRVRATGATPDLAATVEMLKANGDLDRIGNYTESGSGVAYLETILSRPPTAANAVYYAGKVREAADKRRAIFALERAHGLLLDGTARALKEVLADVKCAVDEAAAVAKPESPQKPARVVLAEHPCLHEPVIEGLLRRGETANIIAAPKMGKSWLSYGLALSVIQGGYWLGQFRCRPGKVLLIDNELHEPTLASRLRTVADAMGYSADDFGDDLCLLPLRGHLMDIHAIARQLATIEPGEFDLVVLDAFYRTLPHGTSENDNSAVAQIYNAIDAAAAHLQCAWVNIHHASKGNQAEKSVTDVGAGAGSQSRAADAHLILRPHEEDGAVVLEAVVRSFAPVEPVPLRWTFPCWERDDGLDPTLLRGRLSKGEERKLDGDKEAKTKILDSLQEGAKTTRTLRGKLACGRDRINRLLDGLEADGLVGWDEVLERGGKGRRYYLKSKPEPEHDDVEF